MSGWAVRAGPGWILVLAVSLTAGLFGLEGHVGLDLADEGYLWYGAQATARGEVPIRDFQAYDPARYYWTAAWFRLAGDDGVVALRVACSAFQSLGLVAALFVLRRSTRAPWLLALAGAGSLLWIWPLFRAFDCVPPLVGTLVATRLLERPTLRRHLEAGVFVGLAACFGRNHGLYAFVSCLVAAVAGWRKGEAAELSRRLAGLAAGILAGYAPMLVMLASVPGFREAVGEGVAFLARRGVTTIARPIPWPWTLPYQRLALGDSAVRLSVGLLYLLVPLFHLGCGWALVRARALVTAPVLGAGVLVGAPYLHHAFSRADLYHLAPAMGPFLLALLSLCALVARSRARVAAGGGWAALLAISLLPAGARHLPYLEAALGRDKLFDRRVGRDVVWLRGPSADIAAAVKRIDSEHLGPADEVFVAPVWPAVYPLLGRRAPVWPLILTWPLSSIEQQRLVSRIEGRRVGWGLVCDIPIDNRPELRFSISHAAVWSHLETAYLPVPVRGLPEACRLLCRRPCTGGKPPQPLSGAGTQ